MQSQLTQTEKTKLENLQNDLNQAYGNLESAVSAFNDTMSNAQEEVDDYLTKYNGALAELKSFVENVASEKRSEWEDRSDTWRDGEKGQAVDEWITNWENAELDEVEIEYPDELKLEFDNHSDVELPTEP